MTHYLSSEGKERLEKEIHELKTVKRRELADKIDTAKSLGDLSENAEYHDAKNQLGFVEGRIREIAEILKDVLIITEGGGDTVQVGSTIQVSSRGDVKTYKIVGVEETDPLQGRISNESPLGRAFIGHHAGETVDVQTPGGSRSWEITSIS